MFSLPGIHQGFFSQVNNVMQMITSTSDAPGDISQRAAGRTSQQTTRPPLGVFFFVEDEVDVF